MGLWRRDDEGVYQDAGWPDQRSWEVSETRSEVCLFCRVFLVLMQCCPRNAVAVIIKIAYGYQLEDTDDPLIQLVDEGMRASGYLNRPGRYWVEFMPFCELPAFLSSLFSA